MGEMSRRSLAQSSLGAAAALLTAGGATEATAALKSLDKADANKGGHRARAMALVEQAIQEVRAGIAYAA